MGVPGLADILPARLSMYVALAVAVAVALWAGAPGRLGTARLAAAAVALVTVVPSPHRDVGRPRRPFRRSSPSGSTGAACVPARPS